MIFLSSTMVECMSPGVNGMGTIRDVYVVVSNDAYWPTLHFLTVFAFA